jgi:hypothetical protein
MRSSLKPRSQSRATAWAVLLNWAKHDCRVARVPGQRFDYIRSATIETLILLHWTDWWAWQSIISAHVSAFHQLTPAQASRQEPVVFAAA